MTAVYTLVEARAAGLELALAHDPGWVGAGRPPLGAGEPAPAGRTLDLIFTWAPTPEELAERILERAAIQEEGRAPGEDPPAGWVYCREGRLAGCWVGPGGELAASSGRTPR